MRRQLALSCAAVMAWSAASAETIFVTGAQCRARGGVPDSAITSRSDPDPVRACHLNNTAPSTTTSPARRASTIPAVIPTVPSTGLGNAGAVLGGVANVLGAGAALIDALPKDEVETAPMRDGPAPPGPGPQLTRPAAPARRGPLSPLRADADARMSECRTLLANGSNTDAKACFEEAKKLYDQANLAEDVAAQTTARKASYRPDGPTRGKVPEGCLVLGEPEPTVIGCGGGKEWFYTRVSVKKNARCPRDFKVRYLDPGTGKATDAEEFPGRLQTCGAGVAQAWIDQ